MEQHFMIHKPYGYLSQFINNQQKRKNKKLLGSLGHFPQNTMAIGRLDEASEGLLLLTTSGKTSNYINSTHVEKEYLVQVDGQITEAALEALQKGVRITVKGEAYLTKPCKAILETTPLQYPIENRRVRDKRHGPTSWIRITLTEGKFRQVRKMTSKVGFPTLRLIRIRIGHLVLNLCAGNYKTLSTEALPR